MTFDNPQKKFGGKHYNIHFKQLEYKVSFSENSLMGDKTHCPQRKMYTFLSVKSVIFIRFIRDAHRFKAEALPFPKSTIAFF